MQIKSGPLTRQRKNWRLYAKKIEAIKTIVYILLSVAALIGIIAAILFFTDDSQKRKMKLEQLEKAREAKAEKKLIREIENEYSTLTENSKSDASKESK